MIAETNNASFDEDELENQGEVYINFGLSLPIDLQNIPDSFRNSYDTVQFNIKTLGFADRDSRFVTGFDYNLNLHFVKSFGFGSCVDLLIGGAIIKNEKFILAVLADVGFGNEISFNINDPYNFCICTLQGQVGADVYIAKKLGKCIGVYADVKALRAFQVICGSGYTTQKGFVIKPSIGIAYFPGT